MSEDNRKELAGRYVVGKLGKLVSLSDGGHVIVAGRDVNELRDQLVAMVYAVDLELMKHNQMKGK